MQERKIQKSPTSSQMEKAAPGEDHGEGMLSLVAAVGRWTGDTGQTFSFITRWCHLGSATEGKGSRECFCVAWVMPGDCKLEINASQSLALPSGPFDSAFDNAAAWRGKRYGPQCQNPPHPDEHQQGHSLSERES